MPAASMGACQPRARADLVLAGDSGFYGCWDHGQPPQSLRDGSGCLAIGFRFVSMDANIAHKNLHNYGHMFQTIERFFACAILPWQYSAKPQSMHIFVPATHFVPMLNRTVDVNRELATLLGGTHAVNTRSASLHIHRHGDAVPICADQPGILYDRRAVSNPRVPECCVARLAERHNNNDTTSAETWPRWLGAAAAVLHHSRCSSGAEIAQLRVLGFDGALPLSPAVPQVQQASPSFQLKFWTDGAFATRYLFRRAAWQSVGAHAALAGKAPGNGDVALLISNVGASNSRRVDNETTLALALSKYFRRQRPGLRFVHKALETLEYGEEIRLFSRAAVVISLFGSALHNCRFMRPGSLVVELHGAMGNDFFDGVNGNYLYGGLCSSMGVHWLPVAVPGGMPNPRPSPGPAARELSSLLMSTRWRFERPSDRLFARVNVSELLRALELEARGEWWTALTEFNDHVLGHLCAHAPLLLPTMQAHGEQAMQQIVFATLVSQNRTDPQVHTSQVLKRLNHNSEAANHPLQHTYSHRQ